MLIAHCWSVGKLGPLSFFWCEKSHVFCWPWRNQSAGVGQIPSAAGCFRSQGGGGLGGRGGLAHRPLCHPWPCPACPSPYGHSWAPRPSPHRERHSPETTPPGPHASHKPFPQKEGWRGPRTSILGRPVTLQLAACSGGPREEGSREPGLHGCHLPNSFIYLSSSYFLPHPQHVESSGLGIEPVPQGRQRPDPEPAAPQGDSL